MSKIVIGSANGKSVGFDPGLLLATRLLITADSGGGKSWLARVLFEQAFGKIQTIVIDPEGEFASLREKYPFVLAGKGGDTPVDIRSAGMLAHRLLKLRVSAVCDLYELKADLRHLWVKAFLEALIEAPKELRTPVLLGMDELHMFAPEKGQGESEAKQAVIDVATRGRKRGICLGGITQRLAMLDKNVTSQLQNRLIGPTFEEVNVKTAVKLLGIAPGKDEREFHKQIQLLDPGNFFALGRAISRERILIQVRSVETSHPKAFEKHTAPLPPTPAKIKGLLPQLADLPAEAEKKAQTEAEYKREIRDLKQQLAQTQRTAAAAQKHAPSATTVTKADPIQARTIQQLRSALEDVMRVLAKVTMKGFEGDALKTEEIETALKKAAVEIGRLAAAKLTAQQKEFDALKKDLDRVMRKAKAVIEGDNTIAVGVNVTRNEPVTVSTSETRVRRPLPLPAAGGESNGASSLQSGEKAILLAAAQCHPADRVQLSILTGYKRSTRNRYIQYLQQKGLVEEWGENVVPTAAGMAALGDDYEPLPTGEELQQYWLNRLPEGERVILKFVLDAGGEPVEREAIGEATGYQRSTRNRYIQYLQARHLLEASSAGAVKPAAMLFEDGGNGAAA